MNIASDLDQAIRAVCPINGVSIGDEADRSTWSIDYADDATDDQKEAAEALLQTWDPSTETAPDSVSARQFKLQLLAQGLLDQVEAWVGSQSRAVQVAYDNSGSFLRTEPMMTAGFAAMGFSPTQINDFFIAAAKL